MNFMKISQKTIAAGLIVIVLIAAGVWIGYKLAGSRADGDSGYSAVYLSTGDIYFGKLSWFPHLRLENAWHLERTVDSANQPRFGVIPMESTAWGASGTLYLNPKEVVFWTSVRKDSDVFSALRNPEAFRGQALQNATGTPTSK